MGGNAKSGCLCISAVLRKDANDPPAQNEKTYTRNINNPWKRERDAELIARETCVLAYSKHAAPRRSE